MADDEDMNEIEAPALDVHGVALFDRICDYITDKEWVFTAHAKVSCLVFELRMCDGTVRVVINAVERAQLSRVLVYTTYLTYVPEQRRLAVAEAIARVNYAIDFGNFEMDFNDGEVRIRTVLESDFFIGETMIDRAVRTSLALADQYQAALLAIAFGTANPIDILELASHRDGSTLQ